MLAHEALKGMASEDCKAREKRERVRLVQPPLPDHVSSGGDVVLHPHSSHLGALAAR